jgi:dienelactone hydrolase
VVTPIYKGTYDRGEGPVARYLEDMNVYPEFVVQCAKDLGRTIDFLETRTDIQANKLAYLGFSLGGMMGPLLLAVEPRVKVSVLYAGGINYRSVPPQVDGVNFAPRVKAPTLMINGRWDFTFTEPSQRQLFRLLGTPAEHKRHVLYDRGHAVGGDEPHQEILAWLDRYLGPAK